MIRAHCTVLAIAASLCGGCSLPSLPKLPSLGASDRAKVPASPPVLVVPLPLPPETSTDPAAQSLAAKASPVACQADEKAKQRARALVVTLTVSFEAGADEVGSGVLIGQDGEGLYVLTARHVVSRPFQKLRSISARLADGTEVRAHLAPRQPRTDPPFTDIASLVLPGRELARSAMAARIDWEGLAPFENRGGEAQLSIAGNPAGRGFTQTALSKAEISGDSISITQSAEGGMSGGGVFDNQNSLVGLAHSDNGRYALAYPITPLLALLSSTGIPVRLRAAPLTPPNVYLASVFGQPDALRKAVQLELSTTLDQRGLESGCLRSGSYKLSVGVEALYPSGARSVARMVPDLKTPNGGRLTTPAEEASLHHVPFMTPFSEVEPLRGRLKETIGQVVDKVVANVNDAVR